jgi:hypothetical protein
VVVVVVGLEAISVLKLSIRSDLDGRSEWRLEPNHKREVAYLYVDLTLISNG